MSSDLIAFVSARLKEEESDALESKNAPDGAMRFLDADRWTEALSWQANEDLVLRRVEAIRAIVKRYERESGSRLPGRRVALDILIGPLRDLATIWRDHPDYRPEWKP